MLYITGDIHGSLLKRIRDVKRVGIDSQTANNLIITGDFGLPWYTDERHRRKENHILDQAQNALEKCNMTVYFVDGNHENYDLLYSFPLESDGTRLLRPRIKHLPRGGLYRIGSFYVFAFGGALSTDRGPESLGRGYWREELPTSAETAYGFDTLNAAQNVDLVVSHAAPAGILPMMGDIEIMRLNDPVTKILEAYRLILEDRFPWALWYFGHYHRNLAYPPISGLTQLTYTCLYENIDVINSIAGKLQIVKHRTLIS
jgi:hypothetical protein